MNFKKAFTLTEVLIAMAVLGIIVSASVPVILKMSPNKNAIMLKKAYYTTETIVNSLINDPELYNPDEGFNDLSAVTVGNQEIEDGDQYKFRKLFAMKLNTNTTNNATGNVIQLCGPSGEGKNGNDCVVYSNDGTLWILSAANFNGNNNSVEIHVDVNDGLNNMSYYAPNYTGSDYNGDTLDTADTYTQLVCQPGQSGAGCDQQSSSNNAKTAIVRIKKHVDRAVFTVTADGQVQVAGNQQYILDIISGKEKVIGK